MKLNLLLNADQITLDDLIMLDELSTGKIAARQLKEFVCRFAADETGTTILPPAEASLVVGKMTIAELTQAFEALRTKVKELQATAVPPETSGG